MDVFIQKVQERPINGKHSLIRKLGEGGHGAVYLGRDFDTGEEVALKLEHKSLAPSILEGEAERYQEFQGLAGFPELYWYGWHDDYRVMVFEILGPSLEDLFEYCDRRFSLKTVLMLADQLFVRLEELHSRNVIHRDIKPQNFLVGRGTNGNIIYVTDFGLVNNFKGIRNNANDLVPRHPRLIGTTRFASVREHEGRTQSPRADLESLGYIIIYFMQGKLPWQGLKARGGQENKRLVIEKKAALKAKELCIGLPSEFVDYIKYAETLSHGVMPDYAVLRQIFRGLASKEEVEYNNVFN
ncbi:hypothetical protein BST61_g10845 [Cercospora zeina]